MAVVWDVRASALSDEIREAAARPMTTAEDFARVEGLAARGRLEAPETVRSRDLAVRIAFGAVALASFALLALSARWASTVDLSGLGPMAYGPWLVCGVALAMGLLSASMVASTFRGPRG